MDQVNLQLAREIRNRVFYSYLSQICLNIENVLLYGIATQINNEIYEKTRL